MVPNSAENPTGTLGHLLAWALDGLDQAVATDNREQRRIYLRAVEHLSSCRVASPGDDGMDPVPRDLGSGVGDQRLHPSAAVPSWQLPDRKGNAVAAGRTTAPGVQSKR